MDVAALTMRLVALAVALGLIVALVRAVTKRRPR